MITFFRKLRVAHQQTTRSRYKLDEVVLGLFLWLVGIFIFFLPMILIGIFNNLDWILLSAPTTIFIATFYFEYATSLYNSFKNTKTKML